MVAGSFAVSRPNFGDLGTLGAHVHGYAIYIKLSSMARRISDNYGFWNIRDGGRAGCHRILTRFGRILGGFELKFKNDKDIF